MCDVKSKTYKVPWKRWRAYYKALVFLYQQNNSFQKYTISMMIRSKYHFRIMLNNIIWSEVLAGRNSSYINHFKIKVLWHKSEESCMFSLPSDQTNAAMDFVILENHRNPIPLSSSQTPPLFHILYYYI